VMILLLTIPSAVGLAILGESMIGIVFQHGKFLASDTRQAGLALSYYAVGLAGYSALKLIAPAFYALGDSKTPMLVSVASIAVNAVAAFTMVRMIGFGHAGLALSTSVVSTFSSLALVLMMRAKIGGLQGREMAVSVAKILAAALVMGVVCHMIVVESRALIEREGISRIANVAIGVPAGAAAFYAVAAMLRVRELAETRRALLRRFRAA
jgi:putative peptidoglycan lipid II flippase